VSPEKVDTLSPLRRAWVGVDRIGDVRLLTSASVFALVPTRINRVAAKALGSVRGVGRSILRSEDSDMLMFKCRECCSNSAQPSRKRSAFERVLFRYSCSGQLAREPRGRFPS
jgi:hypothetical protein